MEWLRGEGEENCFFPLRSQLSWVFCILLKGIALGPAEEGGGGQLGDIYGRLFALAAHQHKGPGQIVAHPHGPALGLGPLQKLPGLKGPAGVVQVEDADDVLVVDYDLSSEM